MIFESDHEMRELRKKQLEYNKNFNLVHYLDSEEIKKLVKQGEEMKCCKSPELKKLHAIMHSIDALFEHMPELENYLSAEQMEILAQLGEDVLTEIGRIHYNKAAE